MQFIAYILTTSSLHDLSNLFVILLVKYDITFFEDAIHII